MNYFQPYPPQGQDIEVFVRDPRFAEALREPWLRQLLAQRGAELLPRFVEIYRELMGLPRSARRTLQRRLVHSHDLRKFINERCSARSDPRTIGKLARSLSGLALLFVLDQSIADAATIHVTTNAVNDVSDGRCSLLEAIANANVDTASFPDCPAGSGADTIVLPARGTFSFKTPSVIGAYGNSGLLITSAITIEGNGAKISRPKSNTLYRLITVMPGGDLTLRNTNVSGGREAYGGAIFNAGNLTITGTTISRAIAGAGGAIFNAAGGNVAIADSELSKNTAYYGGAVFNYFGNAEIENCTISGNRAVQGGGVSSLLGSVQVSDSVISGNQAENLGGGVHGNQASVTISNSTITKNTADTGGGVLNYSGSFTVQHSVVTSNKAAHRGGGTQSWNGDFTIDSSHITNNQALSGAGVGTINSVSLTITNSLIADNRARESSGGLEIWAGDVRIENTTFTKNRAGGMGGGIAHFSGNLELINSTISGNSSKTIGGGIWHQGAGRISNSTISANSAKQGGGIYNTSSMAQLYLERSLISGNQASSGQEIFNRVQNGAGTVHANDFNMIGASGVAGISGFALGTTDIVPTAAVGNILAPLGANGGPTPTHALLTGSPAVDAVPGAHPDCTGTDQRGVSRPQGFGCDVGSFEK